MVNIKKQTISVVIPVKDRFELAAVSIYSVINQKNIIDELVVVDDGSIVLAEIALVHVFEHAKSLGINVVNVRHQYCKGVSEARNTGFNISTSDIICFCDSDDFWLPQKTSVVKEIMSDTKILVLFHSFYWDYKRLLLFRLLPFGRLIFLPRHLMLLFGFLNPSCLSIKRTAYGNGFDSDIKYHEDLEYFLRLSTIEKIWFFNYPLMFMGRIPGSAGGASSYIKNMRKGAINALKPNITISFDGLLAACKTVYHYVMLFIDR